MDIHIDEIANGGDGIGRHDGKAHFVPGVLPGEEVRIAVHEDRGNFARAQLVEVLEPSPRRVTPPCPYFARCGGCSWQYADHGEQLAWKRRILQGQLQHLGRLDEPPVAETVSPGHPYRYRNRLDLHVADGQPALVERSSHRLVTIDDCLLVRPEIEALLASLGRLDGVQRLTLRVGVASGQRLALIAGAVPAQAGSWDVSVAVMERGRARAVIGEPALTEVVAGAELRIGATSFFQVNSAGAAELVRLVADGLGVTEGDTLLDGYSGGGLFSATVGAAAGRVIAVESSGDAIADARHNLGKALPGRHRVVAGRFERVVAQLGEPWTVAVVDPPRAGINRSGIAAVTATEPRAIAYVSCDAASLARDTRILLDSGYRLDVVTPVDMFPQTPHIEAVAIFARA